MSFTLTWRKRNWIWSSDTGDFFFSLGKTACSVFFIVDYGRAICTSPSGVGSEYLWLFPLAKVGFLLGTVRARQFYIFHS